MTAAAMTWDGYATSRRFDRRIILFCKHKMMPFILLWKFRRIDIYHDSLTQLTNADLWAMENFNEANVDTDRISLVF